MSHKMCNIVFLLFASLVTLSHCERLHKQIYSSIEGGAACFRRLNGTHQAGCSSSDKGAVGVVQMIDDVSDANWVVYNATAGPYVAVVSTEMFYNVVDFFMDNPGNIAGILLFDNSTVGVSAFTPDSKCPNEYASAPGSQCSNDKPWNKYGTNLLRRDIPFPIFFLPESRTEEITKIKLCYEKYNLDRNNQNGMPLCTVQLNSFMYAAVNTVVCLRRSATTTLLTPTRVCDPLGDLNVYYSLFPFGNGTDTKKKPVILTTARIDTATLFDGMSPGAASSVVGMVTLITAAATLSKMINITDAHLYERNVLWTLFNGEAFDYIGSQRVAYDIRRKSWPANSPLSPSDIPLHIEVGQIGGALLSHNDNQSWPFYAYIPNKNNLGKVTDVLNEMSTNLNVYNMSLMAVFSDNLPPSSLHSFRRILKNVTDNGELTEILLADHNETFTNMFYNSALDESNKIGFNYRNISIDNVGTFVSTDELLKNGTMNITDMQVKIARLATAVARTLYTEVVGDVYPGEISASAHLVDEMLYCFLRSQACRLLLAADYAQSGSRSDSLPEKPAPLYVGVLAWSGTAPVFAGHLLALLTGSHLKDNHTECDARTDPDFSFYWLRGWNSSGICIQTTMNFSRAVSPAFISSGYDLTSGVYSTWTESVWQGMWARVFVAASGHGARAALITGAISTILTAFITYWLYKNAPIIFVEPPVLVNNEVASGILRTSVNC